MINIIRQRYYDYIAEKLAILTTQIKINGKLNLLHLNIQSETFYRDFLNHLFNYNLQSANDGKANYEAIDLIDYNNHIVVQITSTVTVQKINNTLKKEKIKALKEENYNLKFLFIVDEASKLKDKKFENIYEIDFESSRDFIDSATLLEKVTQLPIEKLTALYDFTRKEFGERPNITRISSNLATIINSLAKEDLESVIEFSQLNEYDIEQKIILNDLIEIKESTFDEYKIYYGMLDRIYKTFIKDGTNKVASILRKLTSLYEKEMITSSTSIARFFNIIEKVEKEVLKDPLVAGIPEEEIEMCVRIIVVDTFIRCKIFKNPRGYTHVIAQRD